MSAFISVRVHRDASNEAEAWDYEARVLEKARAFVASLDGVTETAGHFSTLGSQNLQGSDVPERPQFAGAEPAQVQA